MPGQNDQFNVILGMVFNPGSSVQQAITARDKIQDVFRQLNTQQAAGPLSTATVQKFGEDLRKAIARAFQQDVRNSEVFQSLRPVTQRLVRQTTPTDTSAFAAEQIRLTQAELARAAYQQKAARSIGSEGGYRTTLERTAAELTTAKGVETANRALQAAKEKQARAASAAVQAETTAQQRLAREARREEEATGRVILALEARARAERTAAEKAARPINADINAAAAQTSFPGANPYGGPVSRSQVAVNQAEIGLQAATARLAELRNSGTRTEAQLLSGERAVVAANLALAKAREAEVAASRKLAESSSSTSAQQQQGGLLARTQQSFMAGFRGSSDRPYAEQIGQAFKFSVFYGTAYKLLFGITQTFQATLQEGIAFQQAMSELTLATGRAGDTVDKLGQNLGDQAVANGFAPSEGVLAGARSLGLFGVAGGENDAAVQDRVARLSTRVATSLAFSSGQQTQDIQTNLAAITAAFGGGAEGQLRAYDLDAYLGKRFGLAPGATIQAVSESGTVGRAAGFSQEQVTSIAADLIARTGQTPAAVAGFMAQIFSRGGEGSLSSVANKYGIDPTATLSEQIDKLADVYKTAAPQERAEISAAFGRGKVQNAAIALLQDYGEVRKASAGAVTDSVGQGDKQLELRLNNLGGQIQITTATFQEFANQLGQTGLLDVLGAGVVGVRELTSAGSGVLRLFNELDGPMKAAIIGIGLLALASRTGAAAAAGEAAGRGLTALAGGAGIRGALGAAGAAGIAATLINPATAAIAGLLAIGAFKNTADKLTAAGDVAVDTLNQGLQSGATVDEIRSRASELGAAATDARNSGDGIRARLVNLGADRNRNLDLADRLDAEQARLQALATAQAAADASSVPDRALVTGFDGDSLKQSMDLISASGGTAADQLKALADSITGTGGAAARVTASFDPALFAGSNAQGVYDAISKSSTLNKSQPGLGNIAKNLALGFDNGGGDGDPIDDRKYENVLPEVLAQKLSQGDVAKRLQNALGSITSLDGLTPEVATQIATSVVGDTAQQVYAGQGLPQASIDAAQKQMVDAVKTYLLGQAAGVKDILTNGAQLTNTELTTVADFMVNQVQAALAALPATDYKGRTAQLRNAIRTLQAAIRNTAGGEDNGLATQALASFRRDLAQNQFAELERARISAQQNAKSRAEVARIGRRFLRREINAAIRGGDQDLLAQIIAQAGKGSIAIARAAINDALTAAKAALAVQKSIASFATSLSGALGSLFGGTPITAGADNSEVKNLQGMLDSLDNAVTSGDAGVYATGSDVPGYQAPAAPGASAADQKAKRDAARQEALQQRQNRRLLAIDLTDPLAQAQVELKNARDKLRTDRRGNEPGSTTTQDRIDVRNAQSNLEATKFQQRLDQVTTADELGRISHRKYIAYLEHEHDRLEAIKNRTFQQQQQLDQVDGLLQENAQALQGQFNFGDINLPTPYQVRRRVEELYPKRPVGRDGQYAGGLNGALVTNNNIQIDGADIRLVKQILAEYIGTHARTHGTASRHA